MSRVRKESAPPITLDSDQYDDGGWPKGSLSVTWRSFKVKGWKSGKMVDHPQACWIAEFADLPGYCGDGATISEALDRLAQDFGPRPHYRVKRVRRTMNGWLRYFGSQHNAWAAGAFIGMNPLSPDSIGGAKKAGFHARGERIQKENREFKQRFESRDGKIVAGRRAFESDELEELTNQKIEMSLFLAVNAPWRLEWLEARSKFPPKGD